jgi:polyphosphate glucokinase
MNKKALVIDIGGTNVKLMISPEDKRKFDSGPDITPKELVGRTMKTVEGWQFEAISIGFPAPVRDGKIMKDPKHLGAGWLGFSFAKAFGKPVRVVNDAALQALGSYHGNGRMLFLGLGTGLGSGLVWERNLMPLELSNLPYPGGVRIEELLGKNGLAEMGKKAWRREVNWAASQLRLAFIADYVVLGGGNVKQMDDLPEGVERGHNRNVYPGGQRLWELDPKTRQPYWQIL